MNFLNLFLDEMKQKLNMYVDVPVTIIKYDIFSRVSLKI